VIPFNCDHGDSICFQATKNLLPLAQMRRLDYWAIEQIASDQKQVGFCRYRLICDEAKGRSQVSIGQSSFEAAATKMDICYMKQFHRTWPSSTVGA